MIKNWKLFLESNEDGPKKGISELKGVLKMQFHLILIQDAIFRRMNKKTEIESLVEIVTSKMWADFKETIHSHRGRIEDEILDSIVEVFYNTILEAKNVMIEKSILDGINTFAELYITTLHNKRKKADSEGEEWKEEKTKDLDSMSKSEILELIDKALDKGDEEEFKKLSSYLKEQIGFLNESEIAECVKKAVHSIIEWTLNYLETEV